MGIVLTLTGKDIRTDIVDLLDPVISAGVAHFAAPETPIQRSPTDLSVLMAGAMEYSLKRRGLAPPGDHATLTNSAQVSAYLKKAQQISAAAAAAGK